MSGIDPVLWLASAATAFAVISALASLVMVAARRDAWAALALALNGVAWAVISWAILQFVR